MSDTKTTTTTTAAVASRGVSRVLAKLEASEQSGDYYEAHQMYRTLYFRYLSQKRFGDCLDLLYKGAMKFLKKEQYSSGADLSMLVVDTLEKAGTSIANDTELWIQRLGILLSMIDVDVVEREAFLVSGGQFLPSFLLFLIVKCLFVFRLRLSNGAATCQRINSAIR